MATELEFWGMSEIEQPLPVRVQVGTERVVAMRLFAEARAATAVPVKLASEPVVASPIVTAAATSFLVFISVGSL
jgi:hypothetical protein